MTMTRISDNGTDRDMSADELAEHKIIVDDATAQKAETEATVKSLAAAKKRAETKLAALGLTADEIAAL